MQKSTGLLSDAALACSASIFLVSAMFLSQIISVRSTGLSLLYIVVTAVMYLFAMIAKDKRSVLIKWLISIPCAIGIWWLFIKSEYALRALNWVIPDYGRQSAGGRLAGAFELLTLSLLCLIGLIVSIFVRPKDYERFRKIQLAVCMALMVIVIAVVFILNGQFPSLDYIRS